MKIQNLFQPRSMIWDEKQKSQLSEKDETVSNIQDES